MAKTTKERFEKYYCTTKGRAGHLLNNARGRAKRDNLEFSLDFEWLKPKLEKAICEVTNLPLVLRVNGGKGHKENSFSPSLERKDNALGYTKENTQLVCWIYNRAKGAFEIADLLILARALDYKAAVILPCPSLGEQADNTPALIEKA
jgi:hypothetical protein